MQIGVEDLRLLTADLSFHFTIHINVMASLNDYSLDSEREKTVLILPPARLHIWQDQYSRKTLSHFPATTANLHKAELIFAIATLITKVFMLRYLWRL